MQKFLIILTIVVLVSACRQSINHQESAKETKEQPKIKLLYNFNVYGDKYPEKEIIRLWEELLNKDFREISEENLNYWLPSSHFEFPNRFMSFLNEVKSTKKVRQATVIAIIPIGKDTYSLKTMFNSTYDDDKKMQLEYIYTVEAIKTNQGFKFRSLPQQYYQNWNKKTVGSITYCYDKSRIFNDQLATRLDSFNRAMSVLFKSDIQLPLYFVGKNIFEAQQIMGYDFSPEQATFHQVGAVTISQNKIIFGGNNTEYYPHEIVHLYTNELWGKDDLYFHQWIDEGLAALWGGYLGEPLDYHLKRMKTYLDKHPEEPLVDISTFYFNIDNEYNTNFMYEIGGLICKKVYEKEGMTGILDLLKSGNTDEDFYKAIEKHFNVKKENFGAFIRNELKSY